MAKQYTTEQKAALDACGKTIVSASAGSGKTTVMIDKIVGLILDGADVSKILAVTFTKKAAQQMKDKLKNALIKRINDTENPVDEATKKRLKEQIAAAQNADFSTIHSFCAKLIRTHFYAADTGADFSIFAADDTTGKELQGRAAATLFEEAYDSGDADFQRLLSVFFRKKKDDVLKKTLIGAYAALRDRDGYRELLENGTEYTEEKFGEICDELLKLFHKKCRYYRGEAERELAYFERINAAENARVSIDNAKALIAAFVDFENTKDYFALKDVPSETYKRKQSASKTLPADFAAHADALNECKDAFKKLHERAEKIPKRQIALAEYLGAGEIAKSLAKYVLAFEQKYEEEKRERNALDYNDLEHKALALLQDDAVQKELREQYEYLFVDEYQDVNPVQEKLLGAISGENVFLVGDVKQAIYGFRGSRSEYFTKKREAYALDEGANSLAMNCNFRSAPAILTAVNEIFCRAMTKDTSTVDYEKDGTMRVGAPRYLVDGKVRFHLAEEAKTKKAEASGVYSVYNRFKEVDDEKYNALRGRTAVGDAVARIVEEECASTYFDADEGTEKPVQYKDVAILIRKNNQAVKQGIIASLTFRDIPFSTSSPVCLDDYPEIKTAIDILSYIDNAEQDIPLCSAMTSSAGGFDFDELAKIRLAYPKEKYFRTACKRYAAEQEGKLAEKVGRFFAYFASLRDLSAVTGAAEVLTQLFSDTGMEAALLARRTGKASLKRLRYFLSLSLEPEPLSVHEFLVKLKLMKGQILYAESAGENVVHVMTMHNSKGLEYPVVILGDACATFKGKDLRDEVIVDGDYGVATRYYDVEKMVKKETVLRDLIDEKKKEAERADELNIFYVALTRAKFALHVVFGKEPPQMNVPYAKTYAEFIPRETFEKYLVVGEEPIARAEKTPPAYNTRFDEPLAKAIYAELTRTYPFAGGENLPVKQSATSVMSSIEGVFFAEPPVGDAFAETEEFGESNGGDEPKSAASEVDASDCGLAAEERERRRLTGLAYHAFLQNASFAETDAGGDVQTEKVAAERARMRESGALSEEYDALLDEKLLVRILKSDVFCEFTEAEREIANRGCVKRDVSDRGVGERAAEDGSAERKREGDEKKSRAFVKILREGNFLAALPVKDVYAFTQTNFGAVGEETTLFQGTVDLLLMKDGYAHLVDYKYSTRSRESLKEKYLPQIELYRKAVAKIAKIDEKNVRCTLLNLLRAYAIDL